MKYPNAWLETFPRPQPAAGAASTFRFPGETYCAVKAIAFTLTASAVAGNRFPQATILDGDGAAVARVVSPTALAATLVRRTFFSADLGSVVTSASGDESLPYLDTLFPPGFSLQLSANGLDAGDQLSAIRFVLWRVPSGDMEPSTGATPYEPQ